jgi:hypothetical protein
MHTFVLLAAVGASLVALLAWRIGQVQKRHHAPIDPAPEVLGPKEVHRHRL